MEGISSIQNVFYINLEHRKDRKEHVENELKKIGLNGERFNAIKTKNGAIGCSMSHLRLLQDADKNNLSHIVILEDDITFLNPKLFTNHLDTFLKNRKNEWDVVLFAGNNIPPYKNIDETCIRISSCQTTTGYMVNGHYIKTLMENIKAGLNNLIANPSDKINFAIDRFWFSLQRKDRWFLIIPPTVIQREDYSDIEQRKTNYKDLMTDLDKKWMIQQQMLQSRFGLTKI
jgi:glycosyl transferase family 25